MSMFEDGKPIFEIEVPTLEIIDALVMGTGSGVILRHLYRKAISKGEMTKDEAFKYWLVAVGLSTLIGATIGTIVTLVKK